MASGAVATASDHLSPNASPILKPSAALYGSDRVYGFFEKLGDVDVGGGEGGGERYAPPVGE